MGARDFTLSDTIERNAQLYGERPAFVYGEEQVTHAEHRTRVARLAAGLCAAGMQPGDRIAIISRNNREFVELYGAAAMVGAMLVPINWRLSGDELVFAIENASPKLLLADAEEQPKLAELHRARNWTVRGCGIGQFGGVFGPIAALYSDHPLENAVSVAADSACLMLYTAATDGRPKGALLSHSSLLSGTSDLLRSWSLSAGDVNLGVLPLFHLAGLIMMLATQQAGGATIVLSGFDGPTALRAIQTRGVTLLAEFPPILQTLLDEARGRELSSLRVVTGLDSAETIARLEREWPGATFWAAFGQSETSGFVTLSPYRERPGSAGRPTTHNRVLIVDDADQPLPDGQSGEIVVRGPGVFLGYWRSEADTAFTLRNGWHHTGDLGAFDGQGYLWYKGRSPVKELIKPGGENVYPAEVERVIASHPEIAEVVVIGVPDAQWGEAIKAVCVCKPGQAMTVQTLIDFVGERIARFKRPKHVVFTDILPKTADGAIDRAKVKDAHGHA
jgi:acyl-CoA synthetase (AMP-forming)/AMP-acid ligase II